MPGEITARGWFSSLASHFFSSAPGAFSAGVRRPVQGGPDQDEAGQVRRLPAPRPGTNGSSATVTDGLQATPALKATDRPILFWDPIAGFDRFGGK
jgi:hypothetical protein